MTAIKRYPLDQCALYAIKSPDQLAGILRVPRSILGTLLSNTDNYIRFEKGGRQIQEPKPLLKKIHIRVATLLARVETPHYLHSAIKGRSYITNAATHRELTSTVKLDIKKFYPSARAQAVFHFFLERLCCARDVAGILTKLLTVDGYLPTGGNASAILSFWAYRDMFDEMDELARRSGATFSTYVDDMTITGKNATRVMGYEARKIVGSHRLKAHKAHDFRPGQTKIVTGVALTRAGLQVPLRRQRLIADQYAQLAAARSNVERLKILDKLISRVFEAAQVDPSWKASAMELLKFRREVQDWTRGSATLRKWTALQAPRSRSLAA